MQLARQGQAAVHAARFWARACVQHVFFRCAARAADGRSSLAPNEPPARSCRHVHALCGSRPCHVCCALLQLIYDVGDAADHFYVLLTGTISVCTRTQQCARRLGVRACVWVSVGDVAAAQRIQPDLARSTAQEAGGTPGGTITHRQTQVPLTDDAHHSSLQQPTQPPALPHHSLKQTSQVEGSRCDAAARRRVWGPGHPGWLPALHCRGARHSQRDAVGRGQGGAARPRGLRALTYLPSMWCTIMPRGPLAAAGRPPLTQHGGQPMGGRPPAQQGPLTRSVLPHLTCRT